MSQNFDLWVACQRVFNVTPAIVDDKRALEGGGVVRFLATTRSENYGVFLEDVYKSETAVLATGMMDEEETERVLAVEDDFMDEPSFMVVRVAPSYLDEDTFALEVEVFVKATDETRTQVIERVKECSLEGHFENLWLERQEVDSPAETPVEAPVARAEEPQQERSLLDRWFSKKR
jgi:hypothetical protein